MAAISSSAYFSSQAPLPASTASPDPNPSRPWRRRGGGAVMVEVAAGGVGRARSLTVEDLEELKGCLDLGFGFAYHEIPELCGTLPALELCYSMTRSFIDEQGPPEAEASPLVANWRISGPGDDPEEVKARLKYWAQAVACTVRLCS